MALRTAALVAVLALAGATGAAGQTSGVTGRIERIDAGQQVLVLSDGRVYRLTPETVIYVDRQRVAPTALAAGQTVVVQAGDAVTVQNGKEIVVSRGEPTQAPPGASQVVILSPPPAPSAAPAPGPPPVRQTLYGRVDDVDDDGTIKVDTGPDSFKVRMNRELVRQFREGDTVQIEMTIVPAGTPAASPATR